MFFELTLELALKKKHSKTGEESRFKGTALGIPAEAKAVYIEGSQEDTIQAWEEKLHKPKAATIALSPPEAPAEASPDEATDESSPLTDIG